MSTSTNGDGKGGIFHRNLSRFLMRTMLSLGPTSCPHICAMVSTLNTFPSLNSSGSF